MISVYFHSALTKLLNIRGLLCIMDLPLTESGLNYPLYTMNETLLQYDKGTIIVRGIKPPNTVYDERIGCYRGSAMHYQPIKDYMDNSNLSYNDYVLHLIPCPDLNLISNSDITLRYYQKEAINAWVGAGLRGTIVLPTGAGKTILGIFAICAVNASTLIVVPTIDLLYQWKREIEKNIKTEVGIVGGGDKDTKSITVITYDSCYLMASEIGNRFKLVIFDEVHHLGGEGYATMAEMLACPHRLGLTATYERHDGRHAVVDRLVGGKIYEVGTEELEGTYLAESDYKLIKLNMTPDEKKNYDLYYDRYRKLAAELELKGAEGFKKMIMLSASDARAREALVCRNKARDIAFNSEVKLAELESLLHQHKYDRIIIFTEHNKLVHRISRALLIPSITYETPSKEREYNLEAFRNGIFTRMVTSKVLDEGVDVPEANVGIILSGSCSVREYKQRLGRILRKKAGKKAVMYEIVTTDTSEVGTSIRRHSNTKTTAASALAVPGNDSSITASSNSSNSAAIPALQVDRNAAK